MKKSIILLLITLSLFSSEKNPTKEEVTKLYIATFNRAPDKLGIDYWLNSNLKLSEIAKSFFEQPETKKIYPKSSSIDFFINSVYLNLFNRKADREGFNYWKRELEERYYSRNLFILTLINGALNQDREILNNKTEVGLYFINNNLNNPNLAKVYIRHITDSRNSVKMIKRAIDDRVKYQPENEQYSKYLWHLFPPDKKFANFFGINPKANIDILDAWKITRGVGVKIAIIDGTFDIYHEDLKDNIIQTYNADNNSSDVYNHSYSTSHGSICAGFSASPMNGVGIIGSAPEAKLILISQESNDIISMIRAFEKAKEFGAKVISCSWGTEHISEALKSELKSLYDANITIIFASGNDKKNFDEMGIDDESEQESVIGVGATDERNDVSYYSNYGSNIDILAPGGDTDIVGMVGLDDSGEKGDNYRLGLVNNNYSFVNGTSFSAPLVAGVVALMYSANPKLTPFEIRKIIIETADKIGGESANYINGFDIYRAYGKINAKRAVEKAFNY